MIKRPTLPRSLNAVMLYVTLTALLFGLVGYFIVFSVGNRLIETRYMSEEAVNRRKSEIYTQFSSYVGSEGISGRDSAAVARWTGEHDYVTIYLFGNGREQQRYSDGRLETAAYPRTYDPAQYGRLYPIRFVDGLYQIAITENSQLRQKQVVNIISVFVAALCFIAVIMAYTSRLTRRIIELSKEASEVSSGDLERSIIPSGEDELGTLAQSMDEMRRSVIERMGNERRAWQANTELITAISHDIRTPMTSMIGYLGILCDSDFDNAQSCRQLASSAYGKAMELKDLTDQLFRYFLVYGKAELEMETESFDGRLLLEQLMGEAEFDLADMGFCFERREFDGECTVRTDPVYLKRVADNMVSNIKKYADPSVPVRVVSELRDGMLSLRVENRIRRSMARVESTKIGLRTCEKIMSAMGGSFTAETDGDSFAALLKIPAAVKEEE